MIYIGIDPGKKGGIAIIDEEGNAKTFFFSEGKTIDISQTFGYNKRVRCYVENVHAMPGQGVTSMFNFGENFGFILGCLRGNGLEPILVSPQKWKKHYGLHTDKKDSIDTCIRLFPGVSLKRTNRCTTDSDGMAEALLIANYGRETEQNAKGCFGK